MILIIYIESQTSNFIDFQVCDSFSLKEGDVVPNLFGMVIDSLKLFEFNEYDCLVYTVEVKKSEDIR